MTIGRAIDTTLTPIIETPTWAQAAKHFVHDCNEAEEGSVMNDAYRYWKIQLIPAGLKLSDKHKIILNAAILQAYIRGASNTLAGDDKNFSQERF